ncbi:SHOCT domain-containing protein [Haloarchaeobius iranensis]|uniref:Putative membrane protein n=1 Tax=Haloarchaeobius iranensis TaxID=996166 RepID=A0A1G9ZAJ8_9EURY|nr:SHOCT domain-containing protein [Haloarchaeobius iranensis]SDN18349.1 putative membrane protein [Haloarchaeobius iranensis]
MSQHTIDGSLVTLVLVFLGALLVLPLLFMGFGMMGYGSMMGVGEHGMWNGGTAPGWAVLVGVLMQLGFLAALVAGIYLLYRFLTRHDTGADRAVEELRMAYARGDLTDEEYQQRREALEEESNS